jgi:ribonuclease HI
MPRRRRNWAQELSLPTLLAAYAHGLSQRRIATYGFRVWDVGENRQLMEHSAVAAEGAGVTQALADYRAITEALNWLIREGHSQRRIAAYTDSQLVYQQLAGDRPVEDRAHWPLVGEAQRAVGAFRQLSLELVTEEENSDAVRLAAAAYVTLLEARRLPRVPDVLAELLPTGSQQFLVGERYRVDLAAGTCTCPDFRRMHTEQHPVRCKHLLAALQHTRAHRGGEEH